MKKLRILLASVVVGVSLFGANATTHAADNHYVVKHNTFVYNSN